MSKKKRILSYDGIKGISIIAIILYHLFPSYLPGGFLTVNTFLALGGYFFTYKVEQIEFNSAKRDWSSIWHYFKNTLSRVFFPLLWMMGSVVIGLLLFDRAQLLSIRDDLFSGLFLYNNLYQISADKSYFVRMTEASLFTHLWYNSLYIQSFVLAMVGVFITKFLNLKGAVKAIIWSLIAGVSHFALLWLYVPGQDPSRVYYGIDTRFSSFVLGIMTAYMIPVLLNLFYKVKAKKTLYYLIGIISLIGFVSMPFFVKDQQPETYYFFMPLYSVLNMLLIFSITVGVPLVRKVFEIQPLPWIGRRSYSYYLWYYPVIVLWFKLQRQFDGRMYWLYLSIAISLALVSELTYQLIERQRLILPFTTSFNWKEDWREFQLNNRSLWLAPVGLVLFVIMGAGWVMARNDKPLTQFQLEYQLKQVQPSLFEIADKDERAIHKVKTRVEQLEKELDTVLISKIETENFFDIAKKALVQTSGVGEKVTQITNDNADVINEINALDPELAALVPDEVKLFASKIRVSFFGDSLILLSAPNALNVFLNSNHLGVKSLQIWKAVGVLADWISSGEVNDILVINLGTNAGLDDQGMEDFIAAAGDRQLFFVNSDSAVEHRDSVNQIIKKFAEKYDNVHELDWYSYAKDHPEFYWEGEGVHHTPEGADEFAAFTAKELYRFYNGQVPE